MQQINHWPDPDEPTLPKTVVRDLRRRMLEPFDDEATAEEFWNESSTTLIILDHLDSIEGNITFKLNISHHHKTGQHPENSLNSDTKNPYPITSDDDCLQFQLRLITSLYDCTAQDMHRREIQGDKKAATNAA